MEKDGRDGRDGRDGEFPTDRQSPVGKPVVRGDASVTGERAADAVGFDPNDPESVADAAETVRAFAEQNPSTEDRIYVLRGAAACAALVRAEGSYKAAVERAGGETAVPFVQKWARVHALPQAIRRHVAAGDIAPTAAKHVARVTGEARFALAWAILDGDLTVHEVRAVASDVKDGAAVERALAERGVELGTLSLSLPTDAYLELRRRAALAGEEPETLVANALDEWFDDET